MTTYDFVHLVIRAVGGHVQGRTKLQKTVYFVGVLTGRIDTLGFRAHYYGPYSPAVAGAVQELRGLKFLDQQVSAGAPDGNGFEMTRYDYTLTAEGEQVADEKAAHCSAEWEAIQSAVGRLNATNVHDYVRLAIAAKTHLLSRQAGAVLPADVLKLKAAEHGWKTFSDDEYTDAVKFLEAVGSRPRV